MVPFWRGQLLLFEKPQLATYSSRRGYWLLLVFLFLELIARRLFNIGARSLGMAERNSWELIEMSLLTALACGSWSTSLACTCLN